jgi:predicted cupin superfamily sugar epimerase
LQYENRKNFTNLCCNKDYFGTDAMWHFFATTHGKVYMTWGKIKRLVIFERCTVQNHSKQTIMPEERFRKARTLPGTQKYTVSFLPQKVFSEANVFRHHTYTTLVKMNSIEWKTSEYL